MTSAYTVMDLKDSFLTNEGDGARVAFKSRKDLTELQNAIGAPGRAPFPVIVALHGHVIGLGVDLIGSCDIRYAASNTSFIIKVCRMCVWDSTLYTIPDRKSTLALLPTSAPLLSFRKLLGMIPSSANSRTLPVLSQ